MKEKTELMKLLINMYEQYSYVENDISASTMILIIQEKERQLKEMLENG